MHAAQFLGVLAVGPLVALVALGLRRYRLAVAAVLVTVMKLAAERVVWQVVDRERPGVTEPNAIVRAGSPTSGVSFVSGHVVLVTGLAMVIDALPPRSMAGRALGGGGAGGVRPRLPGGPQPARRAGGLRARARDRRRRQPDGVARIRRCRPTVTATTSKRVGQRRTADPTTASWNDASMWPIAGTVVPARRQSDGSRRPAACRASRDGAAVQVRAGDRSGADRAGRAAGGGLRWPPHRPRWPSARPRARRVGVSRAPPARRPASRTRSRSRRSS